MKTFIVSSLILLISSASASGASGQTVMALEEIRAGMIGVGMTVFEGTEPEEFEAQILGILHNINGPKRNLILARLSGGPLSDTGVIQGMSGSPVYIEGQLIGAVSYALGSFTTEAIAGITPIKEMVDAVSFPTRRAPMNSVALHLPMSPERLLEIFRGTLHRISSYTLHSRDALLAQGQLSSVRHAGTMLRPIGTPLNMSGFDAHVTGLLSSALEGTGMTPVLGGSQEANTSLASTPLRPGDAVSVTLIDGDLSLAGTGTVTMIDEDRVYAFGHQFQNLGPVEFLMNRAHVHTLLPSLMSSSKIASVGEAIGTFQQDRLTGIAGTLGTTPRRIPIEITLRPIDSSRPTQNLHFNIVDDQALTPLLTFVTVLNTLRAYERDAGAATFTVSGTATFQNHTPLTFNDVFSGIAPALAAATSVLTPITFLVQNTFGPISLNSLSLEIVSSEETSTATIERVWLDTVRVRPALDTTLRIVTRTNRGVEETHSLPLRIPANAPATASLLVASGVDLAQIEQQRTIGATRPRNLSQLIRALNNTYRNNRLYVRLLGAHPGLLHAGEPLAALPASALAVYQADRSRGAVMSLQQVNLGEWEVDIQEAVSGFRILTLNLDSQ
ncbi:MAG TPA: SpoIVB peptidase S55 domain-containing protein [Vicinamibacterales bacterium]|jgi:hypothetical protein|nr:SpoIVB peptidase S55 domain-containing protein [Vicinamibacterales bacterium]|tara:strand:+ start:28959 stop:30800 length:1842 start_codon:yes stop_codon:yes gene_type:complete